MKTIDPDIGSLLSSPGLRARTARPWGPGLQARIPIFCTSRCRLQARIPIFCTSRCRLQARIPIFCTARCKHIGRRPIFCTARCKIHEKCIFQYLFWKIKNDAFRWTFPRKNTFLKEIFEAGAVQNLKISKTRKPRPCKISKFRKLGNLELQISEIHFSDLHLEGQKIGKAGSDRPAEYRPCQAPAQADGA